MGDKDVMNVIEVKDVWKKFRLYHDKRPTLKEKFLFRGTGKSEDFWALKGINLTITKGLTVGLIGQNGSGKSTLLKLLTKIIYPNKGIITVHGKVSSLLELGAGFHPDFTGRENIYMNSSIFGLTKREIDKSIDQIVEFSELEEFIDSPIRSYSSGMYMRLAFATAINVDPDVLLLDEILAVGDISFQKKCLNKIKELKNQGKTIVFVSHEHGAVEKLCDKAAWLHHGELKYFGDTKQVIDKYLVELSQKREQQLITEHTLECEVPQIELGSTEVDTNNQEIVQNSEEIDKNQDRWGTKEIEITEVKMFSSQLVEKYLFETGESIEILIYYKVNMNVEEPVFGIGFIRNDGLQCYGTNTHIDKMKICNLDTKGCIKFKIGSLDLLEGQYTLEVAVHDDDGRAYDYIIRKYGFEVFSRIADVGVARIPHEWIIPENNEVP
ncbi:MAG: ABC transporter ATP-binding protein [Carboxydocellales bacterium]